MQTVHRHSHKFPHAAVCVYAQDLQPLATVVFSGAARVALAATEIGFDGATVTCTDATAVLRSFDHLHRQLVAENARVNEVRLVPRKRVQVRAAYSYAMHPHQGLAFLSQRMHELELDDEPEYEGISGIYGLARLPVRFTL